MNSQDMLPNFKRLGIEKEMNSDFENMPETELQKLINSSYFQNPHIANIPDAGEYCEIEVFDCQSDSWWYKDLIGYRFFCIMRFSDYGYGRFVSDFVGVRLTSRKMIVFRGFNPKDVLII